MKSADVIRFNPYGPEESGLVEWERMDPAALVAGEPVQRGHIYHEDQEASYMTGVWDCTAFTEHMGPYAVDEFMYLIEGSLVIALPDGTEVRIEQGQAFVVPKGLECQWKQDGYLRKYFMILDGQPPENGVNRSLQRITQPDLTGVASQDASTAPVATCRTDFINASGNMRVGVRAYSEANFPHLPVVENRLVHVLAGTLELTHSGGREFLEPGDTAYIKQGGTVGWRTSPGTRLLQSVYASV
ncbi:cupin domain-containing protein [Roseovarius aestuariivivens]|uniref:cupin domain-containing protein n=1 Tax=Roseovarius aestuariivivens TaxID=1888910 RepID=UPI001081D7D4|nr:cupin domain-containing protein [Roseovarius aestuariivivens]